MLELAAATYAAPKAGLRFTLREPVRLEQGSCLFLQGENGAGKSTFLEEVFIPHIRPAHEVLYLAQDMEVQQNAIRATLALLDLPAPQTLPDLVGAWVRVSGCRDVIILDEFDKYLDAGRPSGFALTDFGWAVCVSHLDLVASLQDFAHGHALHFARTGSAEVTLTGEGLW